MKTIVIRFYFFYFCHFEKYNKEYIWKRKANLYTAERVYSLFNGVIFANKATLSLRFSIDDHPQPEGPVLEVNHLPPHIDHNTLYDIFHPFGPLSLCKSIAEHGAHRGKALIQFFNLEDSENAQRDLVNIATL